MASGIHTKEAERQVDGLKLALPFGGVIKSGAYEI